jgi:hypothetical protein
MVEEEATVEARNRPRWEKWRVWIEKSRSFISSDATTSGANREQRAPVPLGHEPGRRRQREKVACGGGKEQKWPIEVEALASF